MIIDNRDSANILQFRTEPDAALHTVPANSIGRLFNEIHDFIEIVPNGTTGLGEATFTFADRTNLKREGFLI